MLESNLECPLSLTNETLELINDNILLLLDKIDYLNELQFNFLILVLSIVVLGIIYSVIIKFIR